MAIGWSRALVAGLLLVLPRAALAAPPPPEALVAGDAAGNRVALWVHGTGAVVSARRPAGGDWLVPAVVYVPHAPECVHHGHVCRSEVAHAAATRRPSASTATWGVPVFGVAPDGPQTVVYPGFLVVGPHRHAMLLRQTRPGADQPWSEPVPA